MNTYVRHQCDSEHFCGSIRGCNCAFASSVTALCFTESVHHWPQFLTLPALQKHFVNKFFVFAREFCIEKRRGFLVNFLWSLFPTKRSTKTPRKIRGKFGAEFGAKFGTKFGELSVCNFSDLTISAIST